jgi:hypothetical protein
VSRFDGESRHEISTGGVRPTMLDRASKKKALTNEMHAALMQLVYGYVGGE